MNDKTFVILVLRIPSKYRYYVTYIYFSIMPFECFNSMIIGAVIMSISFLSNIHCKGGSLEDWLEANGAFDNPLITVYAGQVLRGMAYLHDHNFVHGDLKGLIIC